MTSALVVGTGWSRRCGGWRSGTSSARMFTAVGGSAVDRDPEFESAAVRSAQIMGLRAAGVDMPEGADGPSVMGGQPHQGWRASSRRRSSMSPARSSTSSTTRSPSPRSTSAAADGPGRVAASPRSWCAAAIWSVSRRPTWGSSTATPDRPHLHRASRRSSWRPDGRRALEGGDRTGFGKLRTCAA